MKTLPRLGWLLLSLPTLTVLLALSLAASPCLAALTAQPGEDNISTLSGPAMTRLTLTQRTMAGYLRDAKLALDRGEPANEVAKIFYAELASLGLKTPMVDLNRLKTRLGEVGLADAALGTKFPEGGSPVEAALLVYRRDLTLDCIREAIREVARTHGSDTGKLFLGKIGKWAVQKPAMFTLAGDIDFSFVGANPEVIIALRDAFDRIITERTGLSMVAIDSVSTAHGFAKHMVYMGIQGRKFADDAMMGMNEGVERILLSDPDATGTPRAQAVSGKQALIETVIEETAREYRLKGLEDKGRSLANETEKAWNDRRKQTVEPMLSMEMARHLEADIIRNVDVFAAIDIVKKGSKYLRRSNDQTKADLKTPCADEAWATFVEQVDEKAKNASTAELIEFIDAELGKLGASQLFEKKMDNGQLKLLPKAGGAEAFLEKMKGLIWGNVSNGLDVRIRLLTDGLNNRGQSFGIGDPEDLRPERLSDTIKMLATGLEVMKDEHSKIPADIRQKMGILGTLLESYGNTRHFSLPREDIDKIKEVLREAAANENSLLLNMGMLADHIDRYLAQKYDTLADKLPPSLKASMTLAEARIDALNSVLDWVDNTTLGALRERGVLEIDLGRDASGKHIVKSLKFPNVAAINQRLNQSLLGKIGNNTAFKAFNLAQEGEAYYSALMASNTPMEAFRNVGFEIFRRRFPGGGAIESAVMGNYLRTSIEVVYLLYPPLAIPEGLYGIAAAATDKYKGWYWSSKLEVYVDGLYKDATFTDLGDKVPAGGRRYLLETLAVRNGFGLVSYFKRTEIENGSARFLSDPDFDTILWQNLSENDPFIQLMIELKKHEAAGEKVRQHFQQELNQHWAKVKTDFAKAMITRLEDRRASEEALANGEAVQLFVELRDLSTDLEIQEPLFAKMDAEWDSGRLTKFWVWLKTVKRFEGGEPLPEKEQVRAVTILRDYLAQYRKVHASRVAVEEALEGIFKSANLAPLPKIRDQRRLLTGLVFLECIKEKDTAQGAAIAALPNATLSQVGALLNDTLSRQAPGVARDEDFDRLISARLTGELVWSAALKRARAPVFAAGVLSAAIRAHEAETARLLAEFTAHYTGKAGVLTIQVRQLLGGVESSQPVSSAQVSLVELASGTDLSSKLHDGGDGIFQALALREGRYRITAKAAGFTAPKGAGEQAVLEHELNSKPESRNARLWLKPLAGAAGLQAFLETKTKPAVLFTLGRDNTSAEIIATVVAKPDSGKITFQWSVGDEVLATEENKTRLNFLATGRKAGDYLLKLYVEDEKKREGRAELKITIVDGTPLKVVLAEHVAEIFKDQDTTLRVIEPSPGPGKGLNYRWTVKDSAGKQLLDLDWGDRFLINGNYYPGQKLDISVLVQDASGRSGVANTSLSVSTLEQPEKLPLTLSPDKGTAVAGEKFTLTAQASAFPDSGRIQYSWDDGKTWLESNESAFVCDERDVGITQSISVHARDSKGRTGVATAFIGIEKAKPTGRDVGLKISTRQAFHKAGDWVNLELDYDKTRYLSRCEWSGTFKGDTLYPSFKAEKPGTSPLTLTVYENGDDGVERKVGTATCNVVVIKPTKINAPASMNATDIGHASVEIPAELAPYVKRIQWDASYILGDKPWNNQGPKIDFQYSSANIPSTEKNGGKEYAPVTLSVYLYDEKNQELDSASRAIAMKPLGFKAKGSDAWIGGADLNGLNLERKPAKRMRDDNGKQIASATITARIIVKWLGVYAPENDEAMRKEVSNAGIWRALPSPTGAQNYKLVTEDFSVGDFKGYIYRSTGVATRYDGSQWVDLCYPQAGASGYAIVRKGKLCFSINYSAGGGGHGFGEGKLWYDDMPFCKQQTEAALGEILGILGSLSLAPDPAYSASPYTGPKLDGSDTPRPLSVKLSGPAKLGPGQLGTVNATIDGGAAPYTYDWSGDHEGKGTSVTVVTRKPGDLKLTLTVHDGAGASASETITIKVDATNPPIQGLPAQPIYGTSADLNVVLPQTGKYRVLWQSSPNLQFDPVESSDGRTRLTFNRAPADGVRIWTQIIDEAGLPAGESPQVSLRVKAPAMRLLLPSETSRIGSEIPTTIELSPAIDAGLIGFRWLEPGGSFFRLASGNGSRILVTPRLPGPLKLRAEAFVPGTDDLLGEIEGTLTASSFSLKAQVLEPGNRPMIWKEGVGLVPVPRNTYAGDELVTVSVDFEGEAPKGEVRWEWSANEGTTLSANTSRTPTVSRHETGVAELSVNAKNADGVMLGATRCQFQVSVPAEEVAKARQPLVVLTPAGSSCKTGQTLSFTAEVQRGTPPYSYAWSGLSGNGARASFAATQAGKHEVSVTVTDSKGLSARASSQIEVTASDKDLGRAEALRLCAEAREAARRGDFDSALRALEAARAACPDATDILGSSGREVASAAKTAAGAAERKRDFDNAEKLYQAAEKASPGDQQVARALAALGGHRSTLQKLRAKQEEVSDALRRRELDQANDAMSELRRLEPLLPGLPGADTTELSARVFQALNAYQAEVSPKRGAILAAYNAAKYGEARRLLAELVASRPLRKADAAWAANLASQLDQRIQQSDTKNGRAQDKSGKQEKTPGAGPRPDSSSGAEGAGSATTASAPLGSGTDGSGQSPGATTGPGNDDEATVSTPPQATPPSASNTETGDEGTAAPAGIVADAKPQDKPLPPPSAALGGSRTGGPKLIALPAVAGRGGDFSRGLGDLWVGTSAAGGDFARHARFEGGTLVIDVPAGNSWGKAGIASKEPSFIMGDEPVAVKMSIDPERSSGFGIAFAPGAYQDVWGATNVWFTWTRPASQLHADFWFGNSQVPGDGRVSAPLSGQAPAELLFLLKPGFAEVHLPDGRVFSIKPSWLRKGTPVHTHVFTHPNEHALAAKLALRSLTWGPAPRLPAANTTEIPSFGSRALWTGTLPPVWTQSQAAGGDFSKFARLEKNQLIVDTPAGNSWAKTGIYSPERLFNLGDRPVHVVVRVDPARSSGFAVVFAPGGYNDVWGAHNLWFTYTRPSSQVHGDIWFGNTQGDVESRVIEQVPGVAPYELLFTLMPGRAELRLPDGRVREVKLGWLKKDTPVHGHVFSHPNEHHLPCKLALTDFIVGIGEVPATLPTPAFAKQPDKGLRTLWTGEIGGLWAPSSAAGGDYSRHARLEGERLLIDAPAGSGWAKAGVYTPERLFTIGDKPFTVTTRIDPSKTNGYVIAFAAGGYTDVWGANNAWFSWVTPEPNKENFYGGNTQNPADTRYTGAYPGASAPATMQFTFRAGGGGLECRLPDGSVRSYNFSWMTKGTPIHLHIFSHAAAYGLPARLSLQNVEVQTEITWPPAR